MKYNNPLFFTHDYVADYTGPLGWAPSFLLCYTLHDNDWKHPDKNPSTFVHTSYGAQKMNYSANEAILDDYMIYGKWRT